MLLQSNANFHIHRPRRQTVHKRKGKAARCGTTYPLTAKRPRARTSLRPRGRGWGGRGQGGHEYDGYRASERRAMFIGRGR